jgi:hypothetical protein
MRELLLSRAVRRIVADPAFTALVGTDIGRDPKVTDAWHGGWVFQGYADDGGLYRTVEGTGKAAVVLLGRDTWGGPNQHNTAEFPLLRIHVFADCSRNKDGSTAARDQDERCYRVWNVLRPLFHDAANHVEYWDDLRIVSSVVQQDLSLMDVPSGDGLVRGSATVAVVLG